MAPKVFVNTEIEVERPAFIILENTSSSTEHHAVVDEDRLQGAGARFRVEHGLALILMIGPDIEYQHPYEVGAILDRRNLPLPNEVARPWFSLRPAYEAAAEMDSRLRPRLRSTRFKPAVGMHCRDESMREPDKGVIRNRQTHCPNQQVSQQLVCERILPLWVAGHLDDVITAVIADYEDALRASVHPAYIPDGLDRGIQSPANFGSSTNTSAQFLHIAPLLWSHRGAGKTVQAMK